VRAFCFGDFMSGILTRKDKSQAVQSLSSYPSLAALQSALPAASNAGSVQLVNGGEYHSIGGVWQKVSPDYSVLLEIASSYERSKANNCRVNTPIPSAELVSNTVYATGAALQTAFPAASNAAKIGKVTSGSGYVFYGASTGAWVQLSVPTVGYFNPGSADPANYQLINPIAGVVDSFPSNGGALLTAPLRLFGAFPFASGGYAKAVSYFASGATDPTADGTAARAGRWALTTDDVYPCLSSGGGNQWPLTIDDGTGPRRVVDPTLVASPAVPCAFKQTLSGGVYYTVLDFSQVGGRKRRYIEIPTVFDNIIGRIGISGSATFYPTPVQPQIVHLTDSIGGTVAQGSGFDSYANVMQDYSGQKNWWLFSESGTGFLSGNRTHLQKLQNIANFPQLQKVAAFLIAPSVNDGNGIASSAFTAAQITQAVVDALTFLFAKWPDAYVLIPGSTAGTGATGVASQAGNIANENAVIAGILQYGSPRVLYWRAMTDPAGQMIRGIGSINSPTGLGSADYWFDTSVSNDTTHPATQGHFILGAERNLPSMVSAVRALVSSAT
jgi:hypothetical protein